MNDFEPSRLREIAHNLGERVKELNCLYGITRLVERDNPSLDYILQGVVDLIPPAWQYPEITCARIKLKEKRYQTTGFRMTRWKQSEDIVVHGQFAGTLEVYYLKQMPPSDEGPFLKEERNLIHVIAERLGRIIENRLNEERLQSLYERERQLRERLQEEMQRRIDFTRNLIHELKTPLTSLMATSQLLYEEENNQKLGKLARYVWEGANSLNTRIDDLHDVVKGEIGKLKLEIKPLDMARLLRSLVNETQALAEQNNVLLRLKIIEPLPRVKADATRVRQIVLNLLNNAFKYAAEGGVVDINCSSDSHFVEVEVRDLGPGIALDDQQHIFEPGYQIAHHGETVAGLGIGLALCKLLVELHGGKIQVSSEPGKGTSFVFMMPVLRSAKTSKSTGESAIHHT